MSWARADTTWSEWLVEVDATWARAGTTWVAGLTVVDAKCARARADTTCWAGLAEVDATGDDVLMRGPLVTHISIMF